ncbi:MAG TPA: NAD-dependent epimerase/dehydratase family protein [Phycisphaerales bacterium]|nr:NAD-dependent epimerase/dehydratase family protein [Phycisphaerales bacterium]
MTNTSRRTFLQTTAAAGLAIAAAGCLARSDDKPAPAPTKAAKGKKILILGGTGFLGPACTEAALARGHTVTLFNRGKTEARRKQGGRPSNIPDGVEVLYGNRDPEKTNEDENAVAPGTTPPEPSKDAIKGLTQLEGTREWDAVIDTSCYWPRIVKASATLLAPRVKQYIVISSISVYANQNTPCVEGAPLATMPDETVEDFGDDFRNYGPGKALCEKAAETAMPGRVANLRPGFIVGPRDSSRRFLFWPVRCSKGGPMIVPGSEDDLIQVVDVRDLADFIITCIERGTMGEFNVTGPKGGMTMKKFVTDINRGVSPKDNPTAPTWIEPAFLEQHQVAAHESFPLWIPKGAEQSGMHQTSIDRALAAGLTFRDLADTAKASLDWYSGLPADLQTRVVPPMLAPEREAEIVNAWRERK